MQPLKCDLQLQILERCRNQKNSERAYPYPLRTRAPCHCRCSHFKLETKKRNVWRSGFLPKTSSTKHTCSHYNNHYNAFCSITWQTCLYLRTWQQNMITITQPLHSDLQQMPKHPIATHTWTTARCRTPSRNQKSQNVRTRIAAHTSCLSSSPAAATYLKKTQCFTLRPPPQNKSHAIYMQPLQCVLHRYHVPSHHFSKSSLP